MTAIVQGVKVFREGLAAVGTLITLVSFVSFSVFVNFIMTAKKTVHQDALKL
jgi:hypothetical protein